MQTELPSGFAGPAYEESGWCTVEAASASVLKPPALRLDLGRRHAASEQQAAEGGESSAPHGERCGVAFAPAPAPAPAALAAPAAPRRGSSAAGGGGGGVRPNYHALQLACAARREPPLLPEEMERILKDSRKFTLPDDETQVSQLYKSVFEACKGQEALDLHGLAWGGEEVHTLSQTLSRCANQTFPLHMHPRTHHRRRRHPTPHTFPRAPPSTVTLRSSDSISLAISSAEPSSRLR